MKPRHRLLGDMSSLLWQALLSGQDKEHGVEHPNPDPERKPVWVNSAEYGMDNFINMLVAYCGRFKCAPRDFVMVWDGPFAKKLRQGILPQYKADRSQHPAMYEQFDRLCETAKTTLLDLGALSVIQDGMEADDVLCYLSQNLKCKRTILSNDGDITALVNEHTDVYTTGTQVLNTHGSWEKTNKYGPFPFHNVTLYKSLVGDTSDKIPGAKGFGEKAFVKMMVQFGYDGLDLMADLIVNKQLPRLVEDVAECKPLQKILDDPEAVYASWGCARMYPEKVNTAKAPLLVQAAYPKQYDKAMHDKRLMQWYGARRVISAENYEAACQFAMGKLLESDHLALDIETSTPAESDEWLEQRKRNAGDEDGGDLGVDVLGSELTGMGLTFGANQQYTFYFTHDHVEEPGCTNLTSEQIRKFLEMKPASKPIVVQNASFELSVLYREWGEAWKDNGEHGMLPNIVDTKIMKSYVDENSSSGLKKMSQSVLGYDQVSYKDVTQGRKMSQMTAAETLAYGADDTICTAALHNYLGFWMEIEDSYRIYQAVDVGPAYLNALRFNQGTPISLEKVLELQKIDGEAHDKAWATIREFLISKGWAGTTCPRFTDVASFTPAAMKEAFTIIRGDELKTQVRTPSKLIALMREQDELIAALFESGLAGNVGSLNEMLKTHFNGEPEFNTGSTPQMQKFLYETLGLPVRLRNRPTEAMRVKGIREGGARTDDLALQFALKFDAETLPAEHSTVLRALQIMKVMKTKEGLFYRPYRSVQHWKTGLVHSHLNQSATVTRRYSSSSPNMQQLPKHPRMGDPARFREVFIPHEKDALIVSLDFNAQELRVIAERSQDENMLACYIGDNKKDMHSITASRIMAAKPATDLWRLLGLPEVVGVESGSELVSEFSAAAERWANYSYEAFIAGKDDPAHPDFKLLKLLRNLGKKVAFTTEYGAQAPKLAETLLIDTAEAQTYIQAKHAAFPRAEEWKREVIDKARKQGYSESLMGARRHLPDFASANKFDVLRAERQAVNYEIQGSCAEMTKLAETRFWESGLFFKYNCRYISPVHDECVSSCARKDLIPFIQEKHRLMTMPYGSMIVPVVSSISFGPNYGEQIEIGEDPTEEAILAGLKQIC